MDVLARAHELEAAGRRVLHLEIGEPDFTAPEPVVEAAVRALREGRTAYTATLGVAALREAICAFYGQKYRVQVDAARVAITAGASGGLLTALAAYVDPGDEVLLADPGYPAYRHFVRAFEGKARALAAGAASSFQPTLDMVREAWGGRTKGLLLGSPSNPTGTLVDPRELKAIASFVAERGGVLLVDEIYQGLVYGTEPRTALGLEGDVVVINSFSKYFCMTGWRLGWVVLPPAAVRSFEKLAQHFYISAPSAAQHAAVAAFSPESLEVLEGRRREFARRRDFLLPALRDAGLRVPAEPHGAFYIYADCGADCRRFTRALLEKEGVAATPGVDFGSNGTERFVRFAYTRGMGDLEEAAQKIRRFVSSASA
ncbi:MAG TPA: aminotransferase class I/II-fold pyridoxal phosphate-dependent enzyme [Burkholderiales bacterium]|jgi:aspartate/methionine/tyrosine aminotransferase|nr:aminotransferase class I/II-fold pyridoxal phosphate-dependent enzyme [Burkholderiales bacterium]